ncbi:tRNA lysidine(34) synthetase TilS [soil metagenome]
MSRPALTLETLRRELARLTIDAHEARLQVAVSGGVDSTALLHAMAAIARGGASRRPLRALHVEHGLHPESAAWASHCRTTAARLDVPLQVLTIRVPVDAAAGVEAAARTARYAALEAALGAGDILLTAHHRDDQAETLLLQLLRGAGPRGLSAMPAVRPFGRGRLARPLLAFGRAALVRYARRHGLAWLEDPANADLRFARSFLRVEVMPKLRARWPAAAANLARAARHQAEICELADTAAAQAIAPLLEGDCLRVAGLRRLDRTLGRLVLRHWIHCRGFPTPSARKLDTALGQALHAAPDALPCVRWCGAEMRRYRDRLYLLEPLAEHCARPLPWRMESPLELPAGLGRLHALPTVGHGLRKSLGEGALEIGFRQGGECLRPTGSPYRRPLKKLFQERGVVPWMRDRLPLIRARSQLVAVADLWTAHESTAGPGQDGWRIEWRDHPPLY